MGDMMSRSGDISDCQWSPRQRRGNEPPLQTLPLNFKSIGVRVGICVELLPKEATQ